MNISHVKNFRQWRTQARSLLKQNIHPAHINWTADHQTQLMFDQNTEPHYENENQTVFTVPAEFMRLAQSVSCFRDDSRWSLLYNMLWRLKHEAPYLLKISSDPLVKKLKYMQKSVQRDVHKMHAFVRFKKRLIKSQEWYVSWFEPSHLIVPDSADFFVKRFTHMNWSILTPDACAHWDQQTLKITAGAVKSDPEADSHIDQMEDYWRQYYRHIFNPARLKTAAMKSEMPKKFWRNLPEAELINGLTQQSGRRVNQMMNNDLTDTNRLREKSSKIRHQQDQIRSKNQSHP